MIKIKKYLYQNKPSKLLATCYLLLATLPCFALTNGVRTIDNLGVPLWDNSIFNADRKDFSDRMWFEEIQSRDWDFWSNGLEFISTTPPAPEDRIWMEDAREVREISRPGSKPFVVSNADDTNRIIDMMIAADGRENASRFGRLEFLLVPGGEPIMGEARLSRMDELIMSMSMHGCPFTTEQECNIWRTKPHVKETVAPRPRTLPAASVDTIVNLVNAGAVITPESVDAIQLLNRYKLLMAASHSCCTTGITHHLKRAGASQGLVYKFVVDDGNFYQFGDRCLMMSDADLDANFPDTKTAEIVADVRNTCLCKSRAWFEALLAPFCQIYAAAPSFRDAPFSYSYIDGLQRRTTVSINRDVQTVMNQLARCP